MKNKKLLIGLIAGIVIVVAIVLIAPQSGLFQGMSFNKVSYTPKSTTTTMKTITSDLTSTRTGNIALKQNLKFSPKVTVLSEFNGDQIFNHVHNSSISEDIPFAFNVSTQGNIGNSFRLKSIDVDFDGCIGLNNFGEPLLNTHGDLYFINENGILERFFKHNFINFPNGVIQNIYADPIAMRFEFTAGDSVDYGLLMYDAISTCDQQNPPPSGQILDWGKVTINSYTWEDEQGVLHTENGPDEGGNIDTTIQY